MTDLNSDPSQTLGTEVGFQPDVAHPSGDRPAIYVACLASYNAGTLHGRWVWADDADEITVAVHAMLTASSEPDAEEWAIHDYAGFEGLRIEEYESFETVASKAAFISEHSELGAKIAEHFGGNLEDAQTALNENYVGEYESLADYAQSLTTDCGTEIPASLRNYIDWESMGQDMVLNGEVTVIGMGFQSYHVFLAQ